MLPTLLLLLLEELPWLLPASICAVTFCLAAAAAAAAAPLCALDVLHSTLRLFRELQCTLTVICTGCLHMGQPLVT
jgi:hypothetical protein